MSHTSDYLFSLQSELTTGSAREHSYRPALKTFIEKINSNINAVNEPSRSEYGAPDFIFYDKQNKNIQYGYAETKDLNADLDIVEKSEQLKRYLGYPNLILTNYLEFRFFKNGEKYQTVKIADQKFGVIYNIETNFSFLESEIKQFLNSPPEKIKSAEKLAKIMGGKASRVRKNIERFLNTDKNERNEELFQLYEIMKQLLVHDLTIEKFADMYAQTLIYGLFVARYYDDTPDNFTRAEAQDLVPASNPFLRKFFNHIAGPNFDTRLKYIADELCAVFSVSDIPEIMRRKYNLFGETVDKDPIIHFYEDFLFEYDPQLKKQMGAYYTPVPIVQFIIHGVDEILKNEFNLKQGICDTSKTTVIKQTQAIKQKRNIPRVQILDPAVGTATFLNETVKYIYTQFQNQKGLWPSYVEEELLPRLNGFELMMAPYTIAHLKLALTLKETGINDFKQRLRVYLTNTLEEGVQSIPELFNFDFVGAISKESEEANHIKHNTPIMIVMGNPPYSGVSSNMTNYANSLVNKYKVEPGGLQKLQERKNWLNDDYVKFIGFSQDLINKTGEGIVAMITNHGYLDNPTFRGMRWSLANSFSKIYVLDLHGNAKKKEISPDGTPDKNVFDIQQGVSIIFAIKTKSKIKKMATVYRADIYGSRQNKFEYLRKNTISTIKWQKINLDNETYSFTFDLNSDLKSEYKTFIPINDLFPINTTGIVTARDSLVIDINESKLLERMYHFFQPDLSDEEIRQYYFSYKKSEKYFAGDSRGWKLSEAREKLNSINHGNYIQKISYRPFDDRYIYYHKSMVDWGRESIMQHFLNHENIGLMICRQQKSNGFHHVLAHQNIVESSYVSNKTSEIGYSFPLYLFSDSNQSSLSENKVSNLNQTSVNILLKNIDNKDKITPENVFDYIYATLHSPNYRQKFKDFLKSDFPRIPPAISSQTFWSLVKLGEQLRKLHLLDESELGQLNSNFPITGDNIIEKVLFIDNKVYINPTQYFENIDKNTFDFYIGGYQPAQKWLKDRKGQKLNYQDIVHYQQIIQSQTKTKNIMKQIDGV